MTGLEAKRRFAGRIPKRRLGTTGGRRLGTTRLWRGLRDGSPLPGSCGGGAFRSGMQSPTGAETGAGAGRGALAGG